MSYIKEIVNFFFHHNVSGNIKRRVYDRMLHPSQDQERDNALRQIWNGLEASECNNDEIEKNLAVVENILFKGKKEENNCKFSEFLAWMGEDCSSMDYSLYHALCFCLFLFLYSCS